MCLVQDSSNTWVEDWKALLPPQRPQMWMEHRVSCRDDCTE